MCSLEAPGGRYGLYDAVEGAGEGALDPKASNGAGLTARFISSYLWSGAGLAALLISSYLCGLGLGALRWSS